MGGGIFLYAIMLVKETSISSWDPFRFHQPLEVFGRALSNDSDESPALPIQYISGVLGRRSQNGNESIHVIA